MAWTTPASASANAVYTSAFYNANTRDNLNASPNALVTTAGDQLFVTGANTFVRTPGSPYKSATEIVNNSTTLQSDDHLFWAIGANEIWAFRLFFYATIASGSPGLKWAFTVPASCTGTYMSWLSDDVGGNDYQSVRQIASSDSFTPAGVTGVVLVLQGNVVNSSTGGTVQFQWAQASAVVTNVTAQIGSYIDLKRLA